MPNTTTTAYETALSVIQRLILVNGRVLDTELEAIRTGLCLSYAEIVMAYAEVHAELL